MGLTRNSLSTTDLNISKGLAEEFAAYINAVGFLHPTTGETLLLTSTTNGYYQNGSYYEYILKVINDSIIRYNSYHSANIPLYTTTDTSALHTFASSYKSATKGIGAFDDYDATSAIENALFGISGSPGHFDRFLADIVNTYAPSYYQSFVEDLASTNVDALGKTVEERLMAYTPLYYLINNDSYYSGGGIGSSDVAPCWRIRSGIQQGDTSLNTEINLALALLQHSDVISVDFETIWGLGHTQAEDTGNATTNFISWVHTMAAGSTQQQGSVSVPKPVILSQNYPNPFNTSTKFSFSVSNKNHVAIDIFNIRGQHVKTIVDKTFSTGDYNAIWNGVDESGLPVTSGIYLAQMKSPGNIQTLRIILIK
jgi:hypothetical protein